MWLGNEVIYTPEKGASITGVISAIPYRGNRIRIDLPSGKQLEVERSRCDLKEPN